MKNEKITEVNELTKEQKQNIRDKIERFKHIREPYIQAIQIGFSIFVAMMLFILGVMNHFSYNLVDVNKYNITIIENQTNNSSFISQGFIEPIKKLDKTNSNYFIYYSWILLFFVYVFFTFFIIYGTKYENYNKEIKGLYDKLTGIEIKPNIRKPIGSLLKSIFLLLLGLIIGLVIGYILFHN
ncbi:MAG: hypothetical protein Q7R52_03690 [archaeon]|nr:hypothetical protein [archaeon]